uniref:ATP-binding cassette domain-containing protein n=1 Tax=candidate division WOR-3 bacterium TaxID=2052148 RepID=A0A7C4X8K7_UNCW3
MIEIREISKRFNGNVVLDRVNLTIKDASLIVILGPSGTGKTVLLKSILGLIPIDGGDVLYDRRSIFALKPGEIYEFRKQVGFVFQSAALFDSMTVYENIALPILEHTSLSTKEVRERVKKILEVVGLPNREKLYPGSLSGGMKRLVAIGRAIALEPKYIFYDEPTTGLDPVMRDRIVQLIINLKRDYKKTGIVVTHDLETAEAVGDEIYMLKNGKISKLEKVEKRFYG